MSENSFKPMLAAKTPPAPFDYFAKGPVLVSPKIDGVRAIVRNGQLVSRSLKLIPNKHCQKLFGNPLLEGLDGELVAGAPTGNDVMQRTTSGVMRIEGEPDVTFWVFDFCAPAAPYQARLTAAQSLTLGCGGGRLAAVPHVLVHDAAQLADVEAECLALGYEGAMVRDPNGLYKCGRSTAKEGGLIKLKRFEDAEAQVIGFVERMHNGNEATVDNLGHTKRSTHQANKVPMGDLGALVCRLLDDPTVEFNIGTGFSAQQRQELWATRGELLGKFVKYRSFTTAGVKEAPRFPVFVGFRDERDMS